MILSSFSFNVLSIYFSVASFVERQLVFHQLLTSQLFKKYGNTVFFTSRWNLWLYSINFAFLSFLIISRPMVHIWTVSSKGFINVDLEFIIIIGIVLVSLLFIWTDFTHILMGYFHCSLWTCKRRLGVKYPWNTLESRISLVCLSIAKAMIPRPRYCLKYLFCG